ncbi:MAG: YIP1 family protein [Faecalimonas sp.]|nr:YIP1 family protein [Faecalimonas sp.]
MRIDKANKLFKRIAALGLVLVMSFGMVLSVSAADAPTKTYTRKWLPNESYQLQLSREMYEVSDRITAATLGLSESLEEITDIYSQDDGSILLLCGGKSRLIVINADGSLKEEMTITNESGEVIDFAGAQGVYSDADGIIYIADTAHARVLRVDKTGKLIDTLECPDSSIIPSDFVYQPVSVAKDSQGYIYILSQGCYYGALLYNPAEEFLGFYGASTVKATVQDTFTLLWEKLTSNDEKKAASTKKLPYSFVDFDFDADGYLVTCTGNSEGASAESNGKGQIRKIAPNGANILYKKNARKGYTSSSDFNYLEENAVYRESGNTAAYHPQTVVSIAVSEDGYMFALDRTNGLVYIYDEESNLMGAFGGGLGEGAQNGVFKTPVSLTLQGNKIYVADYGNQSITVFEPTAYGMLFREAEQAYLGGSYEEAQSLWEEILTMDRGNQMAYRGLSMVYYNQGDYDKAMEAAEQALDYTVYDLAWSAHVSEWIANNFVWLVLIAVVVIAGIVWGIVTIKKRQITLIKKKTVKLALAVPFHPFDSFTNLKYYNLGSWTIAIVLSILFYVGSTLKHIGVGFLYTSSTPATYNTLYTLVSTIGLLILWAICNFLVCSMFDGKGSLKEVYVATTYSLIPLIVYTFIEVIAKNFVPLSMDGLLSGISTAVLLFTFFLLSIAMIHVHEYDFFKFLWTGLITIFMMLLVVFVIFMCGILLMQCGSFISAVYEEIFYR